MNEVRMSQHKAFVRSIAGHGQGGQPRLGRRELLRQLVRPLPAKRQEKPARRPLHVASGNRVQKSTTVRAGHNLVTPGHTHAQKSDDKGADKCFPLPRSIPLADDSPGREWEMRRLSLLSMNELSFTFSLGNSLASPPFSPPKEAFFPLRNPLLGENPPLFVHFPDRR